MERVIKRMVEGINASQETSYLDYDPMVISDFVGLLISISIRLL